MTSELFSPLVLRSGLVLGNRIAKAAMEEGMAGRAQLPDPRLSSLYRRWGAGGAGLLITGNVMVHAEALTGPGGVVLDGGAPLEPYESPAMAGRPADARTQAREAYFLELATDLAKTSPLPLMLTGGITRRETAEKVLAADVAVIGMGTALAVTPDLPNRWRAGGQAAGRLRPVTWSDKTLASVASMALVRHQIRRIARGSDPRAGTHPVHALACDQLAQRRALRRYRSWLRTSA